MGSPTVKQRLRSEKFHSGQGSPKKGKDQQEEGFKVSAVVLGLFLFLVIGSAIFQIIGSFTKQNDLFE